MLTDIPSTRTKYQEWGINIPTKDSHFIIKAIQVIPTMLQGRWQACRVIGADSKCFQCLVEVEI